MATTRTNTAKWQESRKRWQINVQKDGERKSFVSSTPGRSGQREANAKADEWLQNGFVSASLRVNELYEKFEANAAEVSSTSAMQHIKYFGKNWIKPNIGKRKISKLNDNDIQGIYDKMAAKKLSRKTIQDCSGIISKFLKWCKRNKYSSYRPDDVQIPASARKKGKKVLQPTDIVTLFSADKTTEKGKEVFEPLIYAFRFAVLTGLRPGELHGLEKADIQGNTVNVKRSINVYGEVTQGKNENAVRSFTLSPQAAETLREQLRRNPNGKSVFDLPKHDLFYRRWKRFCKYNGMTAISLYEMRHTFVSVVKMLPEGEIKGLVGHSKNMDTFGVYSHALSGESERTAERVGELWDNIIYLKTAEKETKIM